MIDVYCVNVGTKYNRDFDQKLKESVAKHLTLEHTFTCLTDKPEKDYDMAVTHPELRGVFHKLSLFQFTGNCLFFDLDILINDNIDFLTSEFDYIDFDQQQSMETAVIEGTIKIQADTKHPNQLLYHEMDGSKEGI